MSALVSLSFQRLGTTRNPRPSLTNAERLQAYRMAVEPMLGNAYPWRFAETFDPDPPTPEEVAEAGSWKYGLAQESH